MTTDSNQCTYRIARVSRCSGRYGFPSVWHVFEIHARYSVDDPWVALTRKNGKPREFSSRDRARSALRRLRAG